MKSVRQQGIHSVFIVSFRADERGIENTNHPQVRDCGQDVPLIATECIHRSVFERIFDVVVEIVQFAFTANTVNRFQMVLVMDLKFNLQ